MSYGFWLDPVYKRLGIKPCLDPDLFVYPACDELLSVNGIQVHKTAFLLVQHPYPVNKFSERLSIEGIKQNIQRRLVFIGVLQCANMLKMDLNFALVVW